MILYDVANSPDGVEHFTKSVQHRAELFGRYTSKDARQTDVEPVGRDVIGVRCDKGRQCVQEHGEHLGTRVIEHTTEDLRGLLHLRRAETPSHAANVKVKN